MQLDCTCCAWKCLRCSRNGSNCLRFGCLISPSPTIAGTSSLETTIVFMPRLEIEVELFQYLLNSTPGNDTRFKVGLEPRRVFPLRNGGYDWVCHKRQVIVEKRTSLLQHRHRWHALWSLRSQYLPLPDHQP